MRLVIARPSEVMMNNDNIIEKSHLGGLVVTVYSRRHPKQVVRRFTGVKSGKLALELATS